MKEKEKKLLCSLTGKTIKTIEILEKQEDDCHEAIILRFTDNTTIVIRSWDAESYESGFSVWEE